MRRSGVGAADGAEGIGDGLKGIACADSAESCGDVSNDGNLVTGAEEFAKGKRGGGIANAAESRENVGGLAGEDLGLVVEVVQEGDNRRVSRAGDGIDDAVTHLGIKLKRKAGSESFDGGTGRQGIKRGKDCRNAPGLWWC